MVINENNGGWNAVTLWSRGAWVIFNGGAEELNGFNQHCFVPWIIVEMDNGNWLSVNNFRCYFDDAPDAAFTSFSFIHGFYGATTVDGVSINSAIVIGSP